MDNTELTTKILRLHPLQSATLRFNEDGMWALRRFHLALEQCDASIDKGTEAVIAAIMISRSWGGDFNRNVLVDYVNALPEDLIRSVARDIESITISEHALQPLAAGRQKVRSKATEELREKVLQQIEPEADEWGLSIKFETIDDEGIPVLLFHLMNNNDRVQTVAADCWSGCVYESYELKSPIKRQNPDRLCVGFGTISDLLHRAIMRAAERLTAA